MNHNDLPERWVKKLSAYLRDERESDRDHLSATDFVTNQTLMISLQDGSSAILRYAFYLIDRDLNEVAVFTEHCGYHIFPLYGTHLELLESKRTDVGTK